MASKMKTYACLQCNFSTKFETSLIRHERAVHENIREFECPHCSYASGQKFNLQQHVKAVHEKIQKQCPHCQFSTGFKGDMMRHIKLKHRNQPETVDKSAISFSRELSSVNQIERGANPDIQLEQNLVQNNENDLAFYRSPRCTTECCKTGEEEMRVDFSRTKNCESEEPKSTNIFITSDPVPLAQEINDDISETILYCELCKISNTETNILLHIQTIGRDFKCHHCDFTFLQKSKVLQHIKAIHYKMKDYKCPHCSCTSGWKHNMQIHINAMHKDLVNPRSINQTTWKDNTTVSNLHYQQDIYCKQCNKINTQENILQHVRIVMDNKKPFHCLHCNHSNTRKVNLVKHIKTVHYNMLKKLQCPHCSYLTDRNRYLKQHIHSAHEHFTQENIQQETGANSSLKETVSIGNQRHFITLSWQAEDMNEASTSCSALDIVDLTNDDDEKKLVVLKQYKCNWCSSDFNPNNFTLEEMKSHLQENHCLTLKEYLAMNEISFS